MDLHLVPAITLTGTVGSSVRLDYINQFGPIDAWVTLDTVTLTNTSQLYFDVSASASRPASTDCAGALTIQPIEFRKTIPHRIQEWSMVGFRSAIACLNFLLKPLLVLHFKALTHGESAISVA